MGAVVAVVVARAGRAVAVAPGECGGVSSVPGEEQALLSPGGEGRPRGREGAQGAPPGLCSPQGIPPGFRRDRDTATPHGHGNPRCSCGVTLSPHGQTPGCPSPPPGRFRVPTPVTAAPSWALTVDDDAEQEGDEEEQDDAHQGHAEPGELAVGAVPPAHLCPELPAWRRGQGSAAGPFPTPCPAGSALAGLVPPPVPAVLMCPQAAPEPARPSCSPPGRCGVCTNPQAGTEAVPARCGAAPILVRRVLHARCRPGLLALENGVAELGLWDSERGWHPGDPRVAPWGPSAAPPAPAVPCCRPEPRGRA